MSQRNLCVLAENDQEWGSWGEEIVGSVFTASSTSTSTLADMAMKRRWEQRREGGQMREEE
jgi:hypothetical protein